MQRDQKSHRYLFLLDIIFPFRNTPRMEKEKYLLENVVVKIKREKRLLIKKECLRTNHDGIPVVVLSSKLNNIESGH